jgi:hypothetical protein
MAPAAAAASVERLTVAPAERPSLRTATAAQPRISTLRYLELLDKFSRVCRPPD